MYRDNLLVYFSGRVASEVRKVRKVASFYCETEAPGGEMKILVRVAISENFHLVVPKGYYIDVFGGELYKTDGDKEYDFAVYVRECSQINVCAPYKGEMSADELLQKEEH